MDKKIVGYADEVSVAPGERIRFMVSCEPEVSRYRADFVRLLSGDTQPGGPGYRDEPLPGAASGEHAGRRQAVHAGAFGIVPHHGVFEDLESLSLQVTLYPTLPQARRACVLSKTDPASGAGFALWCDPQEGMVLALGDGAGAMRELATGRPLIAKEWYLVQATCDAGSGEVRISQRLLESYARDRSSGTARADFASRVSLSCHAPLLVAAHSRERDRRGRPVPELVFNGRIERPVVASRGLAEAELETLRYGPLPAALRPVICVALDFSREIGSDDIVDISPNRIHGELVNLPIRAVRGSSWTGEEMNFRHAPEHYAAVHFLEDALYDCGWESDFELEVPEGTRSGFYAAKLTSGDQEDHIPFFVRPPPRPRERSARGHRAHRELHGLRELALEHGERARRARLQPPRRDLPRRPLPQPAPRARQLDVRPPRRRHRGVLLVTASPHPQLPPQARVSLAALRRHAPRGLAGEQRHRLRRAHRRGHARGGRGVPAPLPLRHDLHPPRVLLDSDVERALRLHPGRRAPHVPGRQRLLLAGRLPRRQAGGDGDAPGRGRVALLDRRAGRVLHGLQRRARRHVVALRPCPPVPGRQRLRRPGLRLLIVLPAQSRQLPTRAPPSSSRAWPPRSSSETSD